MHPVTFGTPSAARWLALAMALLWPAQAAAQQIDGAVARWMPISPVARVLRESPHLEIVDAVLDGGRLPDLRGGAFDFRLTHRDDPTCEILARGSWEFDRTLDDGFSQGGGLTARSDIQVMQSEACLHPVSGRIVVRSLNGIIACQGIAMPWKPTASVRLIDFVPGGPGYVEARAETHRGRDEASAVTSLSFDDRRTAGGYHWNAPSGILLVRFGVGDMYGEVCYPFVAG